MEPEQQTPSQSEYANAFKTMRLAKNFFALLILVSILVQAFGFIVVNFTGVLDAHPAYAFEADTTKMSDEEKDEHVAEVGSATYWGHLLAWALPATKFLALVSAILLTIILLTSVQISLLGRLGGVRGLIGAFFWSLLLLAMVVPWQQALEADFACGALYNFGEIAGDARPFKAAWVSQTSPGTLHSILYYARFLAFPAVTLLVWLTVLIRFGHGCRKMQAPQTTTILSPLLQPDESGDAGALED